MDQCNGNNRDATKFSKETQMYVIGMGHKLPASTGLVASLRTCDEGMDDDLSRWT